MVKLTWKSFALTDYGGDMRESPVKRFSKCDFISTIGDRILAFLISAYDRIPWRHILPIIILISYTVFGGWLFRYLEYRSSEIDEPKSNMTMDKANISDAIRAKIRYDATTGQQSQTRKLQYRKEMTRRLWRLKLQSTTHSTRERMIDNIWAWYDSKNADECAEKNERIENPWTWWNSTFYAATLYTTIGYGNIAPITTSGRVATIIYSLFGIPLVLTILNDWGMLLFNSLKYLHRNYTRLKNRIMRKNWIPVTREEGEEATADLPVSLAVFMLLSWLCGCAGIFLIWEDEWDYFTAFYFFYISLTTIGLGDVVPKFPQYTLMAFILVLCGLSVVSMSFNIVQTKIESLFRSLLAGIEREYWQKQVDPDKSQLGEETGGTGMGVMQLWKNKPFKQRMLMRMMDKSKKQILQQVWEKKANTKNQNIQTIIKTFTDQGVQVDMKNTIREREPIQEIVDKPSEKYAPRPYIYNLSE